MNFSQSMTYYKLCLIYYLLECLDPALNYFVIYWGDIAHYSFFFHFLNLET